MNYDKCHCTDCLFFIEDDEEVGTCTITENIVEAAQDVCNDFEDSDNHY
jgi:hypothetical protein